MWGHGVVSSGSGQDVLDTVMTFAFHKRRKIHWPNELAWSMFVLLGVNIKKVDSLVLLKQRYFAFEYVILTYTVRLTTRWKEKINFVTFRMDVAFWDIFSRTVQRGNICFETCRNFDFKKSRSNNSSSNYLNYLYLSADASGRTV